MPVTASATTVEPATQAPDLGAATHLSCRECGATAPLGAYYACADCFGPLEVGYDFAGISRERIEAGPKSIWRYRDLLPVPATVADTPTKAAEIVAQAKIPAAVADQAAEVIVKLWETFVGRGRHAGRGEPAGPRPAGQGRRAGRQGHARRQRRLPAPRSRRPGGPAHRGPAGGEGEGARTSTTSSSTARSGSSATAPGW